MKKVLFITTDILRPREPQKSLAMGYILSTLKNDLFLKENLEIEHIPINCDNVQEQVIFSQLENEFSKIPIKEVEFVALSAYIWGESILEKIVNLLKQFGFQGKIILGGYQITYSHKQELSSIYPFADVFISSYAEESLRKFFTEAIQGKVEYPIFYQEKVDFNTLASPYLSGEIIISETTEMLRFETKRGCCFKCSFCAHRDLSGKSICAHNSTKIFKELDFISQKNIRKVNVLDPIFNMGSDYLKIMEHINQQSSSTVFSLQTRFENINDEFLDQLSSQKFILELGLQTIHEGESKIIQRNNNMEKVTETLKKLLHHNINIEVSMIYGLPNQTYESFKQGIQYLQEIGCQDIVAFPLMLYRGTKLYEDKELYNLKEEAFSDYNLSYVTSSNSFTRDEWFMMREIADNLSQPNGRVIESEVS